MNNHQSMAATAVLNTAHPNTPRWRPIPSKLEEIDNGEVVKRLELLRQKCAEKSPQEIHLLLNPTEIGDAAQAQFSRTAHLVEGVRNVFLLLPLMVTWFSFSLASTAFTQSKAGGASFFDLWTAGFPNSSAVIIHLGSLQMSMPLVIAGWHWFSFADVALTDFILLSFVVVFNQLSHWIESNASREAINLSIWLREEVQQLCNWSLVRPIGTGPDSEQPMWAVQVHSAINSLLGVLESVKDVTENSKKDFAGTIDRFNDTYQQQSHSVDNLIQNTHDIEVAITHLNTLFSDDTYKRLEAILPKMEMQFEKMAKQQEQSTQALQVIAQDIKAASEAIYRLAKPFEAVGLAAMLEQRRHVEEANIELLKQIRSDLGQYKQMGSLLRPGFWRRILKLGKG